MAEASLIGVTLVLLGVFLGKPFAESGLRPVSAVRRKPTLSIMLAGLRGHRLDPAGVGAAVPARLSQLVHEDRRDRGAWRVGIFVAHPALKMPATTPFIPGGGPVVPGTVWPFVCIVIMCGALSGLPRPGRPRAPRRR